MEWVNKIEDVIGYAPDYVYEKDYHFYVNGTEDDYEEIEFADMSIGLPVLEFGASTNKYDIVKTLGADKIKQTVKDAYKEWLKENPDSPELCMYVDYEEEIAKHIDEYVEYYIKEIDKNYKKHDESTDFKFLDNDSVSVFAKDLKTYNGTTLEYVSIMPKKENLSKYIENIDSKKINEIVSNLKDSSDLNSYEEGYITNVIGYTPVFSYESQIDLPDNLNELGIVDVFDINKADLSNITNEKMFIADASHKVNITFSNDGIKAAAATEFGGAGDMNGGFNYKFSVPVKEIKIEFNKPYMYLIIDKDTKEVWFAGSVYEPSREISTVSED